MLATDWISSISSTPTRSRQLLSRLDVSSDEEPHDRCRRVGRGEALPRSAEHLDEVSIGVGKRTAKQPAHLHRVSYSGVT